MPLAEKECALKALYTNIFASLILLSGLLVPVSAHACTLPPNTYAYPGECVPYTLDGKKYEEPKQAPAPEKETKQFRQYKYPRYSYPAYSLTPFFSRYWTPFPFFSHYGSYYPFGHYYYPRHRFFGLHFGFHRGFSHFRHHTFRTFRH